MANKAMKFNYKTCTYKKFKERFTDLIKKYNGIYLHKHRILLHYGLSPRSYKKQLLNDPNIKDWLKKYEYIEFKINEYYCNMIDKIITISLDSEKPNPKILLELINNDKEALWEEQENNSLALNNIVINLPNPTQKEIPIKVIEIDAK